MTSTNLVAQKFINAGFTVNVTGNRVYPTLNRKVSRADVEYVILDLIGEGLATVTRNTYGLYTVIIAE